MNKELIKIFKALADNTRLAIIKEVIGKKEIACQELMKKFPLSQPTLSHHFNKLVDAQIFHSRKEGTLWFYSLNSSYLKKMGIDIQQVLSLKKS